MQVIYYYKKLILNSISGYAKAATPPVHHFSMTPGLYPGGCSSTPIKKISTVTTAAPEKKPPTDLQLASNSYLHTLFDS